MNIPEPQPDSPTWPTVLRFAKLMEMKLSQNRHKGDREAWLKDCSWKLIDRMLDEAEEAGEFISNRMKKGRFIIAFPNDFSLECADVANFAMMAADSATKGKLL